MDKHSPKERSIRKLVVDPVWIALFVVSASLFLFAHFWLEALAASSEVYHVLQHVIIFGAGAGVGASLLNIYKQNSK
jgi:hypothetical protein